MSRAAAGTLVEVPEIRPSPEAYGVNDWAPLSDSGRLAGSGPIMTRDPVPRAGASNGDIYALQPAWVGTSGFGLIADLNAHLGALKIRYDSRVDALLIMDDSTDIGLVLTRRTVEELGGLVPALADGISRLTEARAWPAERRLALGGK